MNDNQLGHGIIEIERALVRDVPRVAEGFAQLDTTVPARQPHRRGRTNPRRGRFGVVVLGYRGNLTAGEPARCRHPCVGRFARRT